MKKIKCIFNIIIIFLLIISCSSSNKDNKEYKEVISTNSYKITNRIQIARVHFDFNKFNLTRDFIENAILLDLRTNTNILKLYIYGHTDNKGKDWWNYRLGLHRALTVSNIISTNYTSENIILKSFSYSNSIADNRTENGRYSNRRADIFIDLVEETLEIQTNLVKVDSKNEFNILSRFNIDLRILLILLLLILLIAIIVILIKFNIFYIKIPKNKYGNNKPILPMTGGKWEGKRGNSSWQPSDDIVPTNRNGTNTNNKTWRQLKDEYGFNSIKFSNGEPDFSGLARGECKIDDFTDDRSANYDQADEKLAKEKGCSPEEVEKWRRENKYSWHECKDCKTMQKVPTEVHGNIPHSGGISEYKHRQRNI